METKPTITFDNQYVLSRIEENKISKKIKIIRELKQIEPLLSDDKLLQMYNKSISIHQSKNQGNGDFLENDILVGVLDKNNISYKKQVTINKSGIIVGFNEKKGKLSLIFLHLIFSFLHSKTYLLTLELHGYFLGDSYRLAHRDW